MNIKKLFNSWFWRDLWYKIDCRICPRNKWATDCIPNTYSDKVQIIPDFLFAAITHFVEKSGEDCFGKIDWDASGKEHKKVARQIKQIYMWVKYDRPKYLIKLDNSYPEKPEGMDWLDWMNDKVPYNIKYKDVIKYETIIEQNDDKFLKMIVSIHRHL